MFLLICYISLWDLTHKACANVKICMLSNMVSCVFLYVGYDVHDIVIITCLYGMDFDGL